MSKDQIISDERIREILLDHGVSEGYFLSSGVLEYPDHIYAAARAIAAEVAPKWQTIDTAPDDGTPVFLIDVRGIRYIGYFNGNTSAWYSDYCDGSGEEILILPSHWMPLPPPPKEISNG